MIPRKLEEMLEQGEGPTLDFKYRLDSPIKTAQAMAAFAKARGGRLLVGVRDDGSLKGVKAEEEWYAAEQAALVHCKPALQPEPKVWRAAGVEILEIQKLMFLFISPSHCRNSHRNSSSNPVFAFNGKSVCFTKIQPYSLCHIGNPKSFPYMKILFAAAGNLMFHLPYLFRFHSNAVVLHL